MLLATQYQWSAGVICLVYKNNPLNITYSSIGYAHTFVTTCKTVPWRWIIMYMYSVYVCFAVDLSYACSRMKSWTYSRTIT